MAKNSKSKIQLDLEGDLEELSNSIKKNKNPVQLDAYQKRFETLKKEADKIPSSSPLVSVGEIISIIGFCALVAGAFLLVGLPAAIGVAAILSAVGEETNFGGSSNKDNQAKMDNLLQNIQKDLRSKTQELSKQNTPSLSKTSKQEEPQTGYLHPNATPTSSISPSTKSRNK